MKKIIIIIVIVVFLVALLKSFTTTKYSHNNIVALIKKGLQNMDNVSFDKESQNRTVHYYFKDDKKKMVSQTYATMTFKDGRAYYINKTSERIIISNSSSYKIKGAQDDALSIEERNRKNKPGSNLRYKFVYIKDEKIENKNCIFVKECEFCIDTNEYFDYNSKGKVPVYWIEKSTGFVIGTGLMELGTNSATPQTIIKNIKCGEVTDDVFELPTDYTVFEKKENGDIEKIK